MGTVGSASPEKGHQRRQEGPASAPRPPTGSLCVSFSPEHSEHPKTKRIVFYALLPNKGHMWTCGLHLSSFPREVQLGDLYVPASTDPQV